jgi:cation:H+ antiporter
MAPLLALPLFAVSLAVTLAAARLFARRLDRLGVRFGFPEALIGLLTALAADGPEVTSALVALTKGAHSVSIGVLVGSNVFNLAAMIGLSGVLAGAVWLPREVLLLEGSVSAAVTAIAAALLLRWIAPPVAAVAALVIVVPYVVLLVYAPRLHAWLALRGGALERVSLALEQREHPKRAAHIPSDPTHHLLALIVLDVALIVAGSVGMVQAAIALSDHWQFSRALLGTLILAPLTSIPNALTGVRLGLARRGSALISETFNSNSINLAVGVIATSLFVSFAGLSGSATVAVGWLVAVTALTLVLLGLPGGMRRAGAGLLLASYAGFVVYQLVAA